MKQWNENFINYYNKHQEIVNISILIILPLIVFSNSLGSYFLIVDDFNTMLHTTRSVLNIFLTNTYGGILGGNYRPVEALSHLIDTHLYGDINPFGRHITNLLLHIFNVILVYKIGSFLTKKKSIGLIAGLLFSVFIINANSLSPVAWISGRTDLLVTFFYLISIYFFFKSLSSGSNFIYVISLIAFVLALMSKEMALTFPLIILLYLILFPDIKKGKGIFGIRFNNYLLFSLISVGIFLIFLALIFNPGFVAKHFSHDGTLIENNIKKIKAFQLIAVSGGGFLIIFSASVLVILKYSKKAFNIFLSLRYSIPYFLMLFIFLFCPQDHTWRNGRRL